MSKFTCNFCGKAFPNAERFKLHTRTHTGERPFKCHVCNKAFTQSGSLRSHLRIHTGEKPFQCKVCNKAFSRGCALDVHSRKHIKNKHKPFKCTLCQKAFSHKSYLHSHHLRVHIAKSYECLVCTKSFKMDYSLRNHMRTHTGEKPYECKVCHKKFANSSALLNHTRIHTGERPFKCTICQKAFARQSVFAMHKLTHVTERPFKCSLCDKSFVSNVHLNLHVKVHTGGKNKAECTICKKYFVHLSSHLKVHTGEKSHKCTLCQEVFPGTTALHRHQAKVHNIGNESTGCVFCGLKFVGFFRLEFHLRSHIGEKPFFCSICGEEFTQKIGRDMHFKRIHHRALYKGKHVCEYCGKAFHSLNSLTIHKRTHTGEKPYSCTICSKKFTTKGNLASHTKVHSGLRPYKCLTCKKAFIHEWSLITHQRVHDGERNPYPCPICGKKFPVKEYLKRHLKRRVHNDAPPVQLELIKNKELVCYNRKPTQKLSYSVKLHKMSEVTLKRFEICLQRLTQVEIEEFIKK